MAVDSRQKRTSMISSGRRLPWFRRFTLPVPDSSVETPDRAQLASIYSGLIASELPEPSFGGGGGGMLLTGVGGGGFSPLSLSPTLWALPSRSFSDNGVTPAVDNDPVYFVDDASESNNNLTQVTLANRPLYDAINATINNKPAWVFDGTNDRLVSTASIGGLNAVTMLAVAKYNSATDNQQVVNCNNSLAAFQQVISRKYVYAGVGINGYYADTDTGWNILVSRYDGSQTGNANRLKAYQNGGTSKSLTFTGTVPSTLGAGSGDIWIGGISGATAYLNGGVAEVIIIPTTLTDTQLNSLGNYLATRYGLSWTDI